MDNYNKNVNIIGDCKNREDFARDNCLSVIHASVNKTFSNAAIIKNYICNIKT